MLLRRRHSLSRGTRVRCCGQASTHLVQLQPFRKLLCGGRDGGHWQGGQLPVCDLPCQALPCQAASLEPACLARPLRGRNQDALPSSPEKHGSLPGIPGLRAPRWYAAGEGCQGCERAESLRKAALRVWLCAGLRQLVAANPCMAASEAGTRSAQGLGAIASQFRPCRLHAQPRYAVPQTPDVPGFTTWHPDSVPGVPADGCVAAFQAPAGLEASSAGRAAREVLDSTLPATGAVLLQELPISTPQLAEEFVAALGYSVQEYVPFRERRHKARL